MPEDKEYMTLDEAARAVGIKRPTLYHYIKKLQLQRRTFPLNKRTYLAHADVERIKTARERPWELAEDTDKRPVLNVVPPALSLKQKPTV